MTRSMSAGPSPASASAASAALPASVEVVSPSAAMWRWRMPVRWVIHSSVVSTIVAISALAITRCGRHAPTPRTTERILVAFMNGGVPKGA